MSGPGTNTCTCKAGFIGTGQTCTAVPPMDASVGGG
jgi:hypothetical protein